MESGFRKYGIEYGYGNSRFALTVMATSPDDAMRRVKTAAAFGQCYTPHGIALTIPAAGGNLVANLTVAFLNIFRRTRP